MNPVGKFACEPSIPQPRGLRIDDRLGEPVAADGKMKNGFAMVLPRKQLPQGAVIPFVAGTTQANSATSFVNLIGKRLSSRRHDDGQRRIGAIQGRRHAQLGGDGRKGPHVRRRKRAQSERQRNVRPRGASAVQRPRIMCMTSLGGLLLDLH
jgi:hypothetical protein